MEGKKHPENQSPVEEHSNFFLSLFVVYFTI